MSNLAQWVEKEENDEDENLVWDDAAELKVAMENRRKSKFLPKHALVPPQYLQPQHHPSSHAPPRHGYDASIPIPLGPPPMHACTNNKARKLTQNGSGPSSTTSSTKTKPKHGHHVHETKRSSSTTASSSISTGGTPSIAIAAAKNETEQLRRFLLAEVKQMSIERLVADAKRYMYLEDFHANYKHHEYVYCISQMILSYIFIFLVFSYRSQSNNQQSG